MIKVIRNPWIVTQNSKRDIVKGDIVIEDERIVSVGGVYNGYADVEINAEGDVAMPGMVNTHTHVAMSVMKGVVDDLSFPDFLNKVFKIDADRTDEDIDIGARLGCMEMMLGGTTTFVDLYYSEDVIAEAVKDAGIRGVLCWCTLDEEMTTQIGNPVDNAIRFRSKYKNERKIIPSIGLQGVYVCNEETCVRAHEFAVKENIPLNMHLSETRGEVNDHRKKTNLRPVQWLKKIGVLSDNIVAAHSAWITMHEASLMGDAGVSVSLCPVSNMKLATGGVAPVPEYMDKGVNVSLGTDGNTTNNSLDMFSEMKICGLLQKSARWDPTVATAQQLLDFATIGGAKAIRMEKDIGSIEPGKYADIVLLDGKAPNLRPLLPENLVANIVYSASSFNVKTVMCQGDIVVENRKILTLNVNDVIEKSEDVWRSLCLR